MIGDLDRDGVFDHVLAVVGAERDPGDLGGQEGAARLVLAPARQFVLGEQALVLGGLLGPDVDDDGVMSELDVIIIHIRAEQAAEYERLFAERELPRWREYKARGAFISARIFRAAFGTDRREDVVKYVIAVEVPSHAQHSEHDADPGFQEFNRLADAFQPEDPLVYGGEVLHAV